MIQCPWCAHVSDAPSSSGSLFACPDCLNVGLRDEDGTWRQMPGTRDFRDDDAMGRRTAFMAGLYPLIRRLPAMPEVPQRVVAMVHDPLSDMTQISGCIATDPSISMRVLRIANSALFGGVQPFTDVTAACARLGLKQIANVMWSLMTGGMFQRSCPGYEDALRQLWSHSVACACCCEALSAVLPRPFQGAFVAGLAHDIGQTIMLELCSERLGMQVDAEAAGWVRDYHALAGFHAAQYMALPEDALFAILFHERPEALAASDYSVPVCLTALGDRLACSLGYGEDPEGGEQEAPPEFLQQVLDLDPRQMERIRDTVPETIEQMLPALQTA